MRTVQLYIEGERDSGNYSEVELFDDESINLSLSVQNIQDISKVFTDFSQSFTVPASSINNAIFKHFYENDVDSKLEMLTSAIEPALMVIMGMIIGFIVLAMYLPIFQLAGTVA